MPLLIPVFKRLYQSIEVYFAEKCFEMYVGLPSKKPPDDGGSFAKTIW